MEIYHDLESFRKPGFVALTVGTFDGIHSGHRKVFDLLTETAFKKGGESLVWTFNPPPRLALDPGNTSLRFLNTLDEKIELVRNAGIDNLIIFPFTEEFSRLSPEDFITKYLVNKAGAKVIIIGYDHMFGKGGQGGYTTLIQLGKELGYEVIRLDPEKNGDEIISSSRIRELLLEGRVEEASSMLGYHYTLGGKVVIGQQLGRKIGFPTANILVDDPHKLIPAHGVYAVIVRTGRDLSLQPSAHCQLPTANRMNGMCNIGIRPTINGLNETIEVNIFDFDADIYGQEICIQFVVKIREEKKFAGLTELKDQLFRDKDAVERILKDL
jgi:riboflavin kinase / FMN adenylyltransferase